MVLYPKNTTLENMSMRECCVFMVLDTVFLFFLKVVHWIDQWNLQEQPNTNLF